MPQAPGSVLSRILSSYHSTEPSARPKILENSSELEAAYLVAALDGDSEVPERPEDEVDFHYMCFAKSDNGHLCELDGDRCGPIDVATLKPDEDVLCETGLESLQQYIKTKGVENVGFSLLALVPN